MSEQTKPKDNNLDLASEVVWHRQTVTPTDRAKLMDQTPRCIWLTGLSGSGKSTVANALDIALHAKGLKTFLLDGDNIRHGLCKDLGMSEADRTENIRRVGEVAKLMVDAGLIVICAFISPYERDRQKVRSTFTADQFLQIYLSTPLEVCEQRDPKGLYRKARQGQIKHFTGISDPYEIPEDADIVIDTANVSLEKAVEKILNALASS